MASYDPDRIPAHPPTPEGIAHQEPRRHILMTPHMAAIGGLLVFFSIVAMVVVLPTSTYNPQPSDNWLPLSDEALKGRGIYLSNGCVYCHSGFTRPQDVGVGLYYLYPRVSEPGDFVQAGASPNIFGSERTGPDLSQEGGGHPDGWHEAHYDNPRNTMPLSIMPEFSFLDADQLAELIAFNQSQGGKEAKLRYAAVIVGNSLMRINGGTLNPEDAFPDLIAELSDSGDYRADGKPSDASPWGLPWKLVWHMNSFERGYWLTSDPLPVTQQNLIRGKEIYLERCSGCHGETGDGKGPAAEFLAPKPFDFTDAAEMANAGASDGQLYHRILTAGPGTAMENFGTRMSVQDIWRVVLFLRTVPNGSLEDKDSIPTVDMWQQWMPPDGMLKYIDDHPIEEGPGGINQTNSDPFVAAAHWIAPGMASDDEPIYVGGKLPMTQERLAGLIRSVYNDMVEEAYDDALNRGEDLPPKEQILDTSEIVWHEP